MVNLSRKRTLLRSKWRSMSSSSLKLYRGSSMRTRKNDSSIHIFKCFYWNCCTDERTTVYRLFSEWKAITFRWSIFEVGECIVEFVFQFEDLSVFDQLYLLELFTEVENVHGSDGVVNVLGNFAIDANASDGIVKAALFTHGSLIDVLFSNHLGAEHSFDVGHDI